MLQRLLIDDLLEWKRQPVRKPLLLDGVRQVGKTYVIDRIFGPQEFRQVHRLDFRQEPGLAGLFADSLNPRTILSNIELRLDVSIDVERDLVFFDEVGECQPAVDSLKYFAEAAPPGVCLRIGLQRRPARLVSGGEGPATGDVPPRLRRIPGRRRPPEAPSGVS